MPEETETCRLKPEECPTMDEVRVEINRLDAAIVDLFAERWGYVQRAGELKRTPEEATVPWRIQEVIDKVRAASNDKGFPPDLAEALWRQLIGWAIQHEEENLRARMKSDNV